MFAVIKTGGKQYRVAADDVIVVEKLAGDAGDTLVFGEVLMIGDGDKVEMGGPMIGGAQVVGEVVEQRRAAKIIIFKKKQRNTYRRKQGHRQTETVIKITEILAKGGRTVEAKEAAPKAARPKAATAKAKTAKAEGAAPKKAPARKPAAKKE
jgi:large subunit ribosomal protein L21